MWLVRTCTGQQKLDVLWEVLEPLVPTVLNSYRCPCCLHTRNFANCGKFYGSPKPICKTCSRKYVHLVRGGITTAEELAASGDDLACEPSAKRLFKFMRPDSVGKGSRSKSERKRKRAAAAVS